VRYEYIAHHLHGTLRMTMPPIDVFLVVSSLTLTKQNAVQKRIEGVHGYVPFVTKYDNILLYYESRLVLSGWVPVYI
jgi:hypothetical protein